MTGARVLGLACVGLVAAAAALWGAGRATWYRVLAELPGRGQQVVEVTGAQAHGALGGVALLALAGVAGLVAAGGVLRRAVGALFALAGLAVGAVAALGLVRTPFATDGAVPAVPDVDPDLLRYQPTDPTAAPLLAVLGGLLLLSVGVAVVLRERRLPRFGARYAGRAPDGGAPPAPTDPDRAAWQDLDAGHDPTALDQGPTRRDGPGDGTRGGAV